MRQNLSHEIECVYFQETLLIISGPSVLNTYSICLRGEAEATAAAGRFALSILLKKGSDIII